MLLTNNYYRITNKVYKFISEAKFILEGQSCYIAINIEMYLRLLKFLEFILSSKCKMLLRSCILLIFTLIVLSILNNLLLNNPTKITDLLFHDVFLIHLSLLRIHAYSSQSRAISLIAVKRQTRKSLRFI